MHTVLSVNGKVDRVVGHTGCNDFQGIKDFLNAEPTSVDEKLYHQCMVGGFSSCITLLVSEVWKEKSLQNIGSI